MDFMYVMLVAEFGVLALVAAGLWFGLRALRRRAKSGAAIDDRADRVG